MRVLKRANRLAWNTAKVGITVGVFVWYLLSPQTNKTTFAQVTTPIDSVTASYGYSPEGRGPHRSRQSVWEMKDGFPQVRDTIDFGDVYTSVGGAVPDLIWGTGFGVDGTGTEFDTVYATGRVLRYPEGTPIHGAGVNLFDSYSSIDPWVDGEFLGLNYLPGSQVGTDSNGVFLKILKLPVKKDNIVVTDIKEVSDYNNIPNTFELYQNYPNPFNPTTTIQYKLEKPADVVKFNVYDLMGGTVFSHDAPTNPGTHKLTWDGKNKNGEPLSSGVYFYNIYKDGVISETKKMTLIK